MVRVVFFKDDDGSVPVLDFLEKVPEKAQVKIIGRIDRLRQLGHQLRRPEADHLGDGIYELRTKLGHVNYRVLYFFHGQVAAVFSYGFTIEDKVPPIEIQRAKQYQAKFALAAQKHSYEG